MRRQDLRREGSGGTRRVNRRPMWFGKSSFRPRRALSARRRDSERRLQSEPPDLDSEQGREDHCRRLGLTLEPLSESLS